MKSYSSVLIINALMEEVMAYENSFERELRIILGILVLLISVRATTFTRCMAHRREGEYFSYCKERRLANAFCHDTSHRIESTPHDCGRNDYRFRIHS